MKTMVVDLETSDEEEEDKDEDADRFTVTSSGAIAKGTRPVSQISLNLPVIWPFREHSEERERKKDSHDLSSLKGKARSDEVCEIFLVVFSIQTLSANGFRLSIREYSQPRLSTASSKNMNVADWLL